MYKKVIFVVSKMGAIDNIKIKAGRAQIKKELKKRSSRSAVVCNIKDAVSVGLLFKISEEKDIKTIFKFEKFLKSEFGVRKVFSLGYFDEKEEPEYLKSSVNFDFIVKKSLSWKGIPSNTAFDNFIHEKFDILIDFTDYFNVPLRFVSLRSQAKFKIGKFSEENTPFYDLMIDSKENDFENYANEVVRYLTMLNAK